MTSSKVSFVTNGLLVIGAILKKEEHCEKGKSGTFNVQRDSELGLGNRVDSYYETLWDSRASPGLT